jgi:hypothetical protein
MHARRYGINDIDHVVAAVDDADRAGEAFARMGFTVTPLSLLHNVGVANRLVLLQPRSPGAANFFEVMSPLPQYPLAPGLRPHLVGASGYRWIVLSGADAERTHRELVRDGYAFAPPVSVKRDWQLSDSQVLHVAFDVLLPTDAPLPFNFCAYHTLEHYLRPEFLCHPNGARSMTDILCMVDHPDQFLSYFERLFGVTRRARFLGIHAVTPGGVALLVGDRDSWHASIGIVPRPEPTGACAVLGCRIVVDSLRETRAWLRAAGFEGEDCEVGLRVQSPLQDRTALFFYELN